MIRSARLLLCLGLVLPLTGCIASTTLVNVKANGSGTIEQTTTMNPEAIAQMMKMMTAFGGKDTKVTGTGTMKEMFSEADARAAASKMGEGVRFVSATKIKEANAEGLKAVYAFDDINRVKVSQKPEGPGGASGTPGLSVGSSRPEELTFHFTKQPNGNSLLAVQFPMPDLKLDEADKPREPAKPADVAPQAVEMMKQMFKGLRIDIAMQVDGTIVKTNSPFQEGSRITLMSLDFETLLANEEMLKKMQQPRSVEEAKLMLKDLPGVKVNLEREITIEFAAR